MADPLFGPCGTPLRDTFPVDGDPGAGWVGGFYGGYTKPSVVSGRIDATAAYKSMRRDAPTPNADCEIWGTPTFVVPNTVSLVARASATYGAAGTQAWELRLEARISGAGSGEDLATPGLYKWQGASSVRVASGPLIMSGTPVALGLSGPIIRAFYWNGSSWVISCGTEDAAVSAAGYSGIVLKGTLDNLGDDSIIPVNRSLPMLAGVAEEGSALAVTTGD